MCKNVLFASTSVYHVQAWHLQRPVRTLALSELEAMMLYTTRGCWEPNSGNLPEEQLLITTEPSFQPQTLHSWCYNLY